MNADFRALQMTLFVVVGSSVCAWLISFGAWVGIVLLVIACVLYFCLSANRASSGEIQFLPEFQNIELRTLGSKRTSKRRSFLFLLILASCVVPAILHRRYFRRYTIRGRIVSDDVRERAHVYVVAFPDGQKLSNPDAKYAVVGRSLQSGDFIIGGAWFTNCYLLAFKTLDKQLLSSAYNRSVENDERAELHHFPSIRNPLLWLPSIKFQSGQHDITRYERQKISQYSKAILAHDGWFVVLGHTDEIRDDDYNYELGKRRAEEVVGILKSFGIYDKNVVFASCGKKLPIDTRGTKESSENNRCVEIIPIPDPGRKIALGRIVEDSV